MFTGIATTAIHIVYPILNIYFAKAHRASHATIATYLPESEAQHALSISLYSIKPLI